MSVRYDSLELDALAGGSKVTALSLVLEVACDTVDIKQACVLI